jgi:hypothetical protein
LGLAAADIEPPKGPEVSIGCTGSVLVVRGEMTGIHNMQGVLLVGFTEEEAHLVRGWFNSIEPALKIACCREDYLGRTMSEIFEGPDGLLWSECRWQAQKELVPRAAVFSGMTKDEMLGIVEFWSASGSPSPSSRV